MNEINNSPNSPNNDKTSEESQKIIDLLNRIILSLKENPFHDIQELSDEYKLNSLILEIEPNFEKIPNNNKIELVPEARQSNFKSILSSVVNYSNENRNRDKFTKLVNFLDSILIGGVLRGEVSELIKLGEMLIFLTIISSNKNYYIQQVNKIDDNKISNLYYSIIEKYIIFKINTSISSTDRTINSARDSSEVIEIQKIKCVNQGKTIFISKYSTPEAKKKRDENEQKLLNEVDKLTQEVLMYKNKCNNLENEKMMLTNEITELKNKKILEENEMGVKFQEAKNEIENLKNENIQLKDMISQLKEEEKSLEDEVATAKVNYDNLMSENLKIVEQQKINEENYNQILSNNNNDIEKLKKKLEAQLEINQKINNENLILKKQLTEFKNEQTMKEDVILQKNLIAENQLKNEIQVLKEQLFQKEGEIKELKEANIKCDKDKEEEINYYKESYEEQKTRTNEEHKLISESLYKLAVHFMTLKDDLQKRINNSSNLEK